MPHRHNTGVNIRVALPHFHCNFGLHMKRRLCSQVYSVIQRILILERLGALTIEDMQPHSCFSFWIMEISQHAISKGKETHFSLFCCRYNYYFTDDPVSTVAIMNPYNHIKGSHFVRAHLKARYSQGISSLMAN